MNLRAYFRGHYGGKINDFWVNFGQFSTENLMFRPQKLKRSKIVQTLLYVPSFQGIMGVKFTIFGSILANIR